ncbi:MAG TPA: hypothetical protein VMY76_13870 [Gemmatimonadales bacterium]|nr:hypothetical protein [Gemmatimonadales bacterium]
MRQLLFLAVAATLAACHSRTEDQAAAAPESGDTTAVTHQIDPERTGPPGTGGRPSNATVNVDSLGLDSANVQVDSASRTDAGSVSVPQDTLGPRPFDSTSTDTSRTAP